jgi:exodeoxyribonuclease VII small subunit
MKKKESTISYEKIFEQLEKIVQKMDSGDIPLEKSLELFEQGMILIKDGKEKLDNAEARVKKLIKGQDGKLGIEDLE